MRLFSRPIALAVLHHVCLVFAAQAQTPDPNLYYRLTTQYKGVGQALDVFNGGPKNNQTRLARQENVTGQQWRITAAGDGYYYLTTKFRGGQDCLDVQNGGPNNNQPHVTTCGNVTGQLWQLVPEGDWFRLKSKFTGGGMCLDIFNTGPNDNQPYLKACGNYSGQLWKLTSVGVAPTNESIADSITFKTPRHDDAALDWCWARGSAECGKRVADWLCRKRFYGVARDFRSAKAPTGTRFIGSTESCSGSGCVGFEFITCGDKIPSEARFANPIGSIDKKRRLDWCREFGANCGAPVAAAFCKKMGYRTWVYYEGNPTAAGTITIGTKQSCDRGCTAMDLITCQ